jgi:hypothetical protein
MTKSRPAKSFSIWRASAVDAARQLLLGNQNGIDFPAPMARRLLDAFRHFMEFKGKAAGGKFIYLCSAAWRCSFPTK